MAHKKNNTITHEGPWSQRQRLEHISRVLFWRGWIRRSDLTSYYGISPQQVSADLVVFQNLQPDAVYYETHRKRYEIRENFQPGLYTPDPIADLQLLGYLSRSEVSIFEEAPSPLKVCITKHTCQLVRSALAQQSVEVEYFCANSGETSWHRMSPSKFIFDGLQLHVRGWCFTCNGYRDFVISRISGIRKPIALDAPLVSDAEWNTSINITLRPAPHLDGTHRTAVEMDYGMKDGVLHSTVRKAMLIHFRRRLGFSNEGSPVVNACGELELTID